MSTARIGNPRTSRHPAGQRRARTTYDVPHGTVLPGQFGYSQYVPPEKRLWLAVVEQALDDLRTRTEMHSACTHRADARAFFLSDDFERVCGYLDLDVPAARESLAPLLAA